MPWSDKTLSRMSEADDFRVAPFRPDGRTTGTPTFIWSVVAAGGLYIRAYSGTGSSWYRAAVAQGAGQVSVAGETHDVTFAAVQDPETLDRIDAAYRAKYGASRYLAPMISARASTVQVLPQ